MSRWGTAGVLAGLLAMTTAAMPVAGAAATSTGTPPGANAGAGAPAAVGTDDPPDPLPIIPPSLVPGAPQRPTDPAPGSEPEPKPEPEPKSLPAPNRTPKPESTPRAHRPAPLLERGDDNRKVQRLQVRLLRVRLLRSHATGYFGEATRSAVATYQDRVDLPRTGAVDRATLASLRRRTGKVSTRDLQAGQDAPYRARLPRRCRTGEIVCIDKEAHTVRRVVDGTVTVSLDARFGASGTPTREGMFVVNFKDRDHVSGLYGSAMPFSLFFSRGQAVHYSSDFAARGYAGASHGCVNTRQYGKMKRLFDTTDAGDAVFVYRSAHVRG